MELPLLATVWLALRADLRRRWRTLLSLALLLGLIGEVVLTAAARRTAHGAPTPPTRDSCGMAVLEAGTATCYNFFLLRYKPGSDVMVASGCPIGSCYTNTDQRPGDIRNYATIRDTPLALGTLLAILAVGTLAHVLLTSVRRRGRDLALLKTLGFTRSQVLRLVAWQACAFAALALLIGLPLGIVAGRWAWTLFADSVGVSSQPDVPLTLILLSVPVTLALAVLIAAWPGWRAARVRPAIILRME